MEIQINSIKDGDGGIKDVLIDIGKEFLKCWRTIMESNGNSDYALIE